MLILLGLMWIGAVTTGIALIFVNAWKLKTGRNLIFDEKVWKVVGIVFGAWLALPPIAFACWLFFFTGRH